MKKILLSVLVIFFCLFLLYSIKIKEEPIKNNILIDAQLVNSVGNKIKEKEFKPSNPSFALMVDKIKKSDTIFYQYAD